MLRKRVIIGFVVLVVLVGLSGSYLLKTHPRYYSRLKHYAKRFIHQRGRAADVAPFHSRLGNDPYVLHRKAAIRSGMPLIRNDKDLKRAKQKGLLVKVRSGRGYGLHRMSYSRYLLSKKAYRMLQEIGRRFIKKAGYGHFFTVTSLTRTHAAQRRLTKANVNATKSISTHSYGVSFDISYVRFDGFRGRNGYLQRLLEDELISLQKQKKIFVVRELKTSCYHVTVR